MCYLDDLFSVAGKTALVTGAASGIGRMAATALIHGGADVMIASRKGADCESVAAELNSLGAPGKAEGFAGDVGTEAGIGALVGRSETPHRHAATSSSTMPALPGASRFETFPYHAWAKVHDRQRHGGLFHLTRELVPMLAEAARDDGPCPHHQSRLGHGHAAAGRRRLFLHARRRLPFII